LARPTVLLSFPRSELCITHKFDPTCRCVRKNSMWAALELRHLDVAVHEVA
jgi:hypothetical protein